MENIEYTPKDQKIRFQAISSTSNTIVLASAGAGKTSLLIEKLIQEIENNTSHYTFAAITFTNKAAKEMRSRINFDKGNLFVGTIDGFLEKEIIEPFINLLSDNVTTFQYSYADKYKFYSFNQGLNQVVKQKVFGSYSKSAQKQGNNFKCDMAMEILKMVSYAREYLRFKYKQIFIDEYQDCDDSMHRLFQYFKRVLGIKLFVVGDSKQSIYQWRGASPRFLQSLTQDDDYQVYNLTENFRSEPDITDLSNAISSDVVVNDVRKRDSIFYYAIKASETRGEVIENLIEKNIIELSNNTYILLGKNSDIVDLYNELDVVFPKEFRYIKNNSISSCPNRVLLERIAKYYFNSKYSEYNFLEDSYLEYDRDIAKKIKKLLDYIVVEPTSKNIEELFFELEISVSTFGDKRESEILQEILNDNMNEILYKFNDNSGKLILTVHSAKGLEADTVVVFTEYFFRYYHFNVENNYVAITRAKQRLILVDNGEQQYKQAINELLDENNKSFLSFDDFINYVG